MGWGLNPFTGFGETDWSGFVFNLVFCATAATIVSGAMAERTKFITYCIYSFIISLVVYPIEAHWVWGATPWLTDMGFTDFAGSACIHMVGGITAFIGAAMLGPRIGKYDKNGKARPILGHNILIGALGVFILWFGWYGFNGAAATDTMQLSQIFATTTVAPAVATVSAMIFTWIRNGKPDVSMSLTGSSTFNLSSIKYTATQTRTPATAPMMKEPMTSTFAHPAVTATRPARDPFKDMAAMVSGERSL